MKRLLPQCIALMLLLLSFTVHAQKEPTIILKTKKSKGSNVSFFVKCKVNGTLNVDFGDGNNETTDVTSPDNLTKITGTVKGSTIKIYGSALNIFFLNCSSQSIFYLDVSKSIALESLDCSSNELTSLNLNQNIELTSLSCYYNKLVDLKISGCAKLTSLNCFNNLLETIEISKNTKLIDLECSENVLKELKVDCNTNLELINCFNNSLQNLDIRNCKMLKYLFCYSNLLSSLDLSLNNKIEEIEINNNLFVFSTLPLKGLSLNVFVYSEQKPVAILETIGVNTELDLGKESMISGVETNYTWYKVSGTAKTKLIENEDYIISNGVTTFLKPQEKKVYCEMTNAKFPKLTLKTTEVTVSTTTAIGNVKKQSVTIFPNPVSSQLTVKGETAIESLQVISATGAVVHNQTVNSTEATLQTAEFTPGIYILKLETDKGTIIRRFAKK